MRLHFEQVSVVLVLTDAAVGVHPERCGYFTALKIAYANNKILTKSITITII